MVEELAGLYVDGLEPVTRRALDAASVVRRTTLSLLQAMLPEEDSADLFARLRGLPFVELGSEGLLVHDAVRAATSALLRAADPARHRAHRSAAWTRLRAELRTAGGSDLWRYTADMLYLVENPIVRSAFFPSGSDDLAIEPARPGDGDAIVPAAIGPVPRGLVAPSAGDVPRRPGRRRVRCTATGACACRRTSRARCCAATPSRRPSWSTCAESPSPPGQRVLLTAGGPTAPTAARPPRCGSTRSARTSSCARTCGGSTSRPRSPMPRSRPSPRSASSASTSVPVRSCSTTSVPARSTPGWADVVGRELQAETSTVLDGENRRLVLDGEAVDLSRLELDVLRHLQRREGVAVTREELLREVWGHEWTGASSTSSRSWSAACAASSAIAPSRCRRCAASATGWRRWTDWS